LCTGDLAANPAMRAFRTKKSVIRLLNRRSHMSKYFTALLAFLFAFTVYANDAAGSVNKENRKQQKIRAIEQIRQLKDGALLVRLHTRENSITALRNSGNDQMAGELESVQREYNRGIVKAFNAEFDFCTVYFFYSNQSESILNKQFDDVVFLNAQLLPDTSVTFEAGTYLTAEFGTTGTDTAKHFSHYSYKPGSNPNTGRVKNYYGSSKMEISALIIKNEQFVQLLRPFPYYVRIYESLPFERSTEKAVRKMNRKLHGFYNKNH